MSERDYIDFLEDIWNSIISIEDFIKGQNFEKFSKDKKTILAIERCIEIIGEASKKILEDIRSLWPEVAWRKISGVRDILIQAYFEVDLEIVWDIVQTKLPVLKSTIQNMLDKDGD